MADKEKDYTRQNQVVIARKERELEKARTMAEAAEEQVRGLFEKALQDERTHQNIARDCKDGWQGKKSSKLGTEDQLGRKRDRGGYNLVDEPPPTGFEKYPWDEE